MLLRKMLIAIFILGSLILSLNPEPVLGEGIVFQSGFGPQVKLSPVYKTESQSQKILGEDQQTGYDWERDLPGGGHFEYLVSAKSNLEDFVSTKIEYLDGKYALFQSVKNDDPSCRGKSRNMYVLSLKEPYRRIRFKYLIKLQSDLEETLPSPKGWRMLVEAREADQGYRWMLCINKNKKGKLCWALTATIGVTVKAVKDWWETNFEYPVPVGKWFSLEIDWKRSFKDDGQITVYVNNQAILTHRGRNQLNTDDLKYHIFKVYRQASAFHSYQWISDFEFSAE